MATPLTFDSPTTESATRTYTTRAEAIQREIIDASDEAARLIGQAADALATIARIRPEIGALLDDVGVTRDLRRALELLRADEVVA